MSIAGKGMAPIVEEPCSPFIIMTEKRKQEDENSDVTTVQNV